METEQLTIEHEGEEFEFTVETHDEIRHIHIFVKEVWWAVPEDGDIETYAEGLRRYARRLEALKANGWEITESDGEHIFIREKDSDDGVNDHEITEQLE